MIPLSICAFAGARTVSVWLRYVRAHFAYMISIKINIIILYLTRHKHGHFDNKIYVCSFSQRSIYVCSLSRFFSLFSVHSVRSFFALLLLLLLLLYIFFRWVYCDCAQCWLHLVVSFIFQLVIILWVCVVSMVGAWWCGAQILSHMLKALPTTITTCTTKFQTLFLSVNTRLASISKLIFTSVWHFILFGCQ